MNKKIFYLLDTFSEDEWDLFGKYLSSPYFLNNRKFKDIFDALQRLYKRNIEYSDNAVQYLTKFLSKGRALKPHSLDNKMSEFYKLALDFIAQYGYDKNRNGKYFYLLKELADRNLPENFYNLYNSEKSSILNNKYSPDNFFYFSKITGFRAYFYQSEDKFTDTADEYYRSTEYMMILFLDRFLHYVLDFCLLEDFGYKKENNISFDILKFLNLSGFIQKIENEGNPVYTPVLIRYYLYLAFRNFKDTRSIHKAKDLYIKHIDSLKGEINVELYNLFEKYSQDSGYADFEKELQPLFKSSMQASMTSEMGSDYYGDEIRVNIDRAMKSGDIQWLEEIIEKFIPSITGKAGEEIRIISLAKLYLMKNEYHKLYELLRTNKMKKQMNIISAFELRMIALFEMSMFEEIYLEIDNLRHYLKKAIVSKKRRQISIENNRIMMMMLKAKSETDKNIIAEIKYYIKNLDKTLPIRIWFLKKIDELEK